MAAAGGDHQQVGWQHTLLLPPEFHQSPNAIIIQTFSTCTRDQTQQRIAPT